jgi:hypothetical protein
MNQSDLTKAQQAQLDEAKEWVGRQQASLDEIRTPMSKMVGGKPLNQRDTLVLLEHLRWTDEEREEFESLDKSERAARAESVLREPEAHFYVGHNRNGENPTHRVNVTPSGVKIIDSDHEGFYQ